MKRRGLRIVLKVQPQTSYFGDGTKMLPLITAKPYSI